MSHAYRSATRRAGPAQGHGRQRPRTPARPRSNGAPSGEFALPVTRTPALPPADSFEALDMPAPLKRTLAGHGLTTPSQIQAATLPNSLAGRDVLGRSRTGSGKTLAFGLALLAGLDGRAAEARRPLAVVLAPTRELAQQVTESLTPYARSVGVRATTVVGGMPISRQARALREGVHLVVATPGRLRDLIERGDCVLDRVESIVLDEADQMTDMGFMPQVTAILQQVPAGGRRMLFSATLDRNVDTLVRRFLNDPVVHSVDLSEGAVSTMEHHLVHVSPVVKQDVATRIAAREGRVIMFLDTKRAVDRMADHLLANGVRAAPLHGGRSQPQRTRTLEQFKRGDVTALIATNVAARGIHVDGLDLVVNIDPPTDHKDYLHRGGRTARAGESGSVVTLVLPGQRGDMTRLMSRARIEPRTLRAEPGDAELARVTGAREPSGVPVALPAPAPRDRPRRDAAPRKPRRRPRR
ncbi:DEAD/DEAH box helicase [Streptomonospora nanhaiensis]|uniref:Superfamily II DNA/RNA helicase n=1 Tax=Streptomonospora nanhaiensis TaxID=1323731 RepID=A0A853BWI7_9ACTN|nr:DEAD/DEAH box helicase [Streptomonospora nanhaiensis]MBV2364476.1 DEAD/DEAH box helicase [Streptomonospora nanhaiensis]MBX9390598.1 DEAD/DEAH box helicase [Streptomonospora nanhaiensis]NYI99176.1 superfamily II DNA/RNA helicase [Streptomonospora nanhaiensis]